MSQAYMSHDQVQEVSQRWAEAELCSDAGTLDQLLDADFIRVGPVGFVINKEQYLAGRRSGDLTQQAFALDDVHIRVYGDAAVAVGTQTQQTNMQGRDASGRFRMTQVLARKGDGWVIASLHLSPITPAPAWILGALQAGPSQAAPRGRAGAR